MSDISDNTEAVRGSIEAINRKLMDGVVWDGKDPKKYAGSFKIKVA